MAKVLSGYGVKVMTDTGHYLWLTRRGTHRMNTQAMRFDTEKAAIDYLEFMQKMNGHATFKVVKLSK